MTDKYTDLDKLPEIIARHIFEIGDELNNPAQRLQYLGGKYPDNETEGGGLCEEALAKYIKECLARTQVPELLADLKAAREKGDWISVEERLPEKKVIATYLNSLGNRRTIVATFMKRWEVESSGESDDYDEYSEELDAYYFREGWYEQQDNWGE